jgi:DNA segregation ATPase FtsK/SpoIIIE, S-DNA-T family
MATGRRAANSTRSTRTGSRRRNGTTSAASRGARAPLLPPHVVRSLLGLLLLVLGMVTFVALLFPASDLLSRYVQSLRDVFGQGVWLLAVLLAVAGIVVERGSSVGRGWAVASVGALITLVAGLAMLQLIGGGGMLGGWISGGLVRLLGTPATFIVLIGFIAAGLILLFNTTLRQLVEPMWSGGRYVASAVTTPAKSIAQGAASRMAAPPVPIDIEAAPSRKQVAIPVSRTPIPEPVPSVAPISQTVVAAERREPALAVAAPPTAAGPVAATLDVVEPVRKWEVPPVSLLSVAPPPAPAGRRLDHARNIRIIEEKLRSFSIPASVTGTNTGPVVTQYEVRPDAHIKLSRIEGLADDLAMALAARSIRIEAPIPGRDVVGIEIPNVDSEIVGFRQVIDETAVGESASKLTFALGRDVAGKAYAVDLARMPHLLIAGATGSGKSVCVNALITSLLLRATPTELRLILIDLKRVELSTYGELPHLLVPVIVEAPQARSVLARVVNVMEQRYETLASARPPERNIASYNANAAKYDRTPMPYIVVVIDELADLMLKEGRKVEEPVVKLAQKARAVGIHLVLATQRPSVNVVTGLIKANVPSRIAFAMTSNVDSRTVLDAPGAEDLIGRGDMLYQPADLPRPIRLQGVFVSDDEVHAITGFWRDQAPEPDYDDTLLEPDEFDDEDGLGQFGWLAKLSDDDLTPRAAQLVMETGKASTSMMQTKLKVGFNRATRLMDELEKAGIVGPLDPRNPATPRVIYGPDNWVRSTAEADAD